MKIRKPWVSWEEFEEIVGGTWTPAAHTHEKADITDTPWAWADVLKAGSNLTDLATRQHAGLSDAPADAHHPQLHAAEHESGGGDAIDALTFSNTGLRILDLGADHYLTIRPGTDLSANRILTLTTGDAARTITLSGNPTLADWFDQAVKQASHPHFASVTVGNEGLHVLDTNASHDLIIKPGSDLTADRILTLTTGNAARTITLSGNPTLADWFDQAVKQASSPTFANLNLGAAPSIRQLSDALTIQTNEGVNTNTIVDIKGKGAGYGGLNIYDQDDAEYLNIYCTAGIGAIKTYGVAPSYLSLQGDTSQDIKCWSAIVAGNPYFYTYGFKAADAVKWLRQRVEADGDALIEAENNLNILAGGGDINFGDENLTTTGIMKADTFHLTAGVTPNLAWLSDVVLGTLEEGETLAYDQGSAQWIDAWGVEYDNPRLVWKMYTDFLRSHAAASPPWTGVALGGATTIQGGASATHPGVLRLSCSPTARSGYYFMTDVGTFIIGGREHSEFIFKTTASFTDKYVRLGWQDSLTFAAPTDGIFLDLSQNVFSGKTYAAGASSTTATTFNLAANTWYRGTISVSDDVNLITFILYTVVADEQTVVWTNTLATNIPGASLGHGVLAYINVADAAGILIYMDMMVASQAGYIIR